MNTIRKIQSIELSILKDYAAFCAKHGLQFFLSEGTLLGAIRHQGFVPWDDDIDVMMPRIDYDKFLELATTGLDSDRYQIQHAQTIDEYWSPFIKMRLLQHDGDYVQKKIEHLTDANGPLLDVFPLDSVPKQRSFFQDINGYYIKFLRRALTIKLGLGRAKGFRGKVIRGLSLCFSIPGIHRELQRSYTRFASLENEYLTNWGSYYPSWKETFHKEDIFAETVRLAPFEGEEFPVPFQAEKVLTRIYGDYLTPPSEKEMFDRKHFVS